MALFPTKGFVLTSNCLFILLISVPGSSFEVPKDFVVDLENGVSSLVFFDPVNPKISHRYPRSINSGLFGTDYILTSFGQNGFLNVSGLRSMMAKLKLGRSSLLKTAELQRNECLTAEEILFKGGFNKTDLLMGQKVDKVSSILVEQILKEACKKPGVRLTGTKSKEAPEKAWGFAVLFVTIISLASMLGGFLYPCMNKEFYETLLLFMVSLAVGVLSGSGIFHLIPKAFNLGKDGDHSYLWKASVLVGGIYFFFITENLMKIYIRFSDWKKEGKEMDEDDQSDDDAKNKKHKARRKTSPPSLDQVTVDNLHALETMHERHALDSVHITYCNCPHEHGVDSLNMGNHNVDKSKALDYYVEPEEKKAKVKKQIAPVAWMIILGDGLHNFIDGLAIGAAFTSSVLEGISTSLAIFSEELPHELGDFAILVNSGMTYKQAILCNFLSACTCYAGMVIGVILGNSTSAVKWIYALAAGMFLYISLVDMLPEATGMQVSICRKSKKETWKKFGLVNFGMLLGYLVMFLLAWYGDLIQV